MYKEAVSYVNVNVSLNLTSTREASDYATVNPGFLSQVVSARQGGEYIYLDAIPIIGTRLHSTSASVMTQGIGDARLHGVSISVLAQDQPMTARLHQTSVMVASYNTPIQLQAGGWNHAIPIGLRSYYLNYQQLLQQHNPLSWWRLDETSGTTALDYGSLLNTGNYVGGPTLSQSGIPAGGFGVGFDGVNDQITAPWNANYKYGVAASRTYMFWYKGTSIGTDLPNTDRGLLVASDSISAKLFAIDIDSLGKIRAYVDDNYVLVGPTTTSVNNNVLHFVALTVLYNGSTYTGRVYIDGIEEASSTLINDLGTGTPVISIGRNNRSAAGYVTGIIDEVCILPVAINAAQVLAIYNAGIAI